MSKKKNYALPITILLRRYKKDVPWLEVLCGLKEKELEKMMFNGKTMLSELQETLLRGQITLIMGNKRFGVPKNSNERLWFLKSNFDFKNCSRQSFKDQFKKEPADFFKKDDISLEDLEKIRSNYSINITWNFKGLNEENDEVTYKEDNPNLTKSVNPEVEKRYERMLKLSKQYESSPEPVETATIFEEEQKETQTEQKEEDSSNRLVNTSGRIRSQLYRKLETLSKENRTGLSTEARKLIEEALMLPNLDFRDVVIDDENAKRVSIWINKNSHAQIKKISYEKNIKHEIILNNLISAALRSRDKAEEQNPEQEEEQMENNYPSTAVNKKERHFSVSATKQKPAEEPKQEPAAKPVGKSKPTLVSSAGGKTFENWLNGKSDRQLTLFVNTIDKNGCQDLIDGKYGVDSINAVGKFKLPEDLELVKLSHSLREDVKAGKILFVTTEEPNFLLRPVIHHNKTIVEMYGLMMEIASLLSSTYRQHSLQFETPFKTTEEKPRMITGIEAYRKDNDSEPLLKLSYTHKRFFSMVTTEDEFEVNSPDILELNDWYTIAMFVQEHNKMYSRKRLEEALEKTSQDVMNSLETYKKSLTSGIKAIYLESINSEMLKDFSMMISNGKELVSEPKLENGQFTVRLITDEGDSRVSLEQMPTDVQFNLFVSMKETVLKES